MKCARLIHYLAPYQSKNPLCNPLAQKVDAFHMETGMEAGLRLLQRMHQASDTDAGEAINLESLIRMSDSEYEYEG